jgi:non-lysosomal glucosylceramidase
MDNPKISAIYVQEAGWDYVAPAVPAGLAAASKDSIVFLDWDNNIETDLCAYEIYRSTNGGVSYSKVGSVTGSKFKDTDVINGNTYHYYVKALDYFDNESAATSAVQATPATASSRTFWPDIPDVAWKRYLGDVPENSASTYPERGVALGGFGAGSFMYNINGTFGPWDVDISKMGYKKINLDSAAFHIYQKVGVSQAVVKTLSPDEGLKPAWDRINVGDATYYALQPKGWVTYDSFDVDVSCEFYSPIIANNYQETSYPVAVWEWLVRNPTGQTAEVSIMLTWPNIEGTYVGSIRKGYQSEPRSSNDISGVVLKAVDAANGVEAQNSEWCVSTKGGQRSYVTSWNANGDGSDVLNSFADDGILSNNSLDSSNSAAAVACKITLGPGEQAVIPVVVSWDMPVVEFGKTTHTEWWRKYTEYFDTNSDNSFDIASAALQDDNFTQWRQKIDAWMKPFIYDPNYPAWLKTAAFNELYYAQFGGCFYEAGLKSGHSQEFMGLHPEDHKHFLIECQQYPNAAPSDLRHYYSLPFAMFWPEIEKEELIAYADGIIYYNPLKGWPEGNMLHDFGDPGDGDPFFDFDAYRNFIPDMPYWRDTGSRYIQECWRYYRMYQDKAFLDYVWPACKAVYGFMKTTDEDSDYLPYNHGNDNTYDNLGLFGTSAHCSGLWIGALEAMREMARVENDSVISEVETWLSNARTNFDSQLWLGAGGYFKKDTASEESEAIMTDALNGQLYCGDWGLEDVVSGAKIKSHLQKVYEECVVPMKDFNSDGIGDVGAINAIYDDGTLLNKGQSDNIWAGVSYYTAALMHNAGLAQEAQKTAYGVYNLTYIQDSVAYWFNVPEGWDKDGIHPGPSNPEQYARSMAVWEYMASLRNPANEGIAVASSYGDDLIPNKALDGDMATRWSSDASDPQWIYIYFMTPKKFNAVRLEWEAAYGRRYEIQTSDDGYNWTSIHTEDDGDGGTDTITFGTYQTARYVRMYGIERGTGWGYSLYEFKVGLVPVAVASSEENQDLSAAKAIDSNSATRWSSAFEDDEWIYIDLGEQKTFDTVKLFWETAYGKRYQIQISDNAADWTTVYTTETDADGGEDSIYLGTQIARYVKMQGVQRGTGWGYSLFEFEVLKAYASSSETSEYLPYKATDSNGSTRWASNFTDDEWIYLDLMWPRDFNNVTLSWEPAYGRQYEIQASEDGVNWLTVYTETNSDGGEDSINTGNRRARYVRMKGIERATGWGYSLWEFKVLKN